MCCLASPMRLAAFGLQSPNPERAIPVRDVKSGLRLQGVSFECQSGDVDPFQTRDPFGM